MTTELTTEILSTPQGARLKTALDYDAKQPSRLTAEQLTHELRQYTGSENWYRHGLNRKMMYTDGVKFFAENGGEQGAYWLLDLIATDTWQFLKKEAFLMVSITVKDNKAVCVVDDGNGRVIKTSHTTYTDLQAGIWKFYLTGDILLLPNEY